MGLGKRKLTICQHLLKILCRGTSLAQKRFEKPNPPLSKLERLKM